jgi:hypothetical protein
VVAKTPTNRIPHETVDIGNAAVATSGRCSLAFLSRPDTVGLSEAAVSSDMRGTPTHMLVFCCCLMAAQLAAAAGLRRGTDGGRGLLLPLRGGPRIAGVPLLFVRDGITLVQTRAATAMIRRRYRFQ